ncbi:MAG: protein kinase [Thermoguttaceae bacterium]|jgi:serine/threonine protein kinase
MSYTVAQAHLGRTVRCERCGGNFVVAAASPGDRQQAPAAARTEFDPYHQWLGISPEEQPPHHYRLLGLKLFESSPAAIQNAADRQMAHLRTFQSGKRAALSQRLLNELAAAKLCLLKAEKKAAYDEQLRRRLVAAAPPPPPLPPARKPAPPGDILPTQDCVGDRPAARPPPPAPDPMLERQLGEYKVLQKLGEGGMGAVYKARHTKLNRDVALKILPKAREDDAEAVVRFEREMQASGALEHPNIVVTHDAREIHGRRFLVMELLDGLDLEQVVRRGQPLSVAEACELIRQAALGLQYAHEHGLVHRDIKPSNLMLTAQRQVKILDLGLAKLRLEGRKAEEVTGTNQALGTPNYMAPEQISETRSVDIRADIYSLGCALYKLLAGHAPFSFPPDTPAYEVMRGHIEKPPPPLRKSRSDVPAKVATVVNRMLAKDPARRFQTPAEVADALGPFAVAADLAALLDRARRTPSPALPSDPLAGTQPSLASSVTRFFGWLQAGGPQPAPKPRPAGRKPKTALLWTFGAIVTVSLVLLAVLVWGLTRSGKTELAKRQNALAVKPTEPSDSRRSKAHSGSEPIAKPDVPAPAEPPTPVKPFPPPETPTPANPAPPPPPADGRLLLTLPQDERQGAKLEIDGKAYNIPSGGDPIKVPLPPGEHKLQIERPGYQAYAWSGKLEAEKEQAVAPKWEAIFAAKPPPVDTLPQLSEAFKRAVGELEAADAQFNEALKPTEDLLAAWDFRGAAEALAKVRFDKPELGVRLEARREEVKRLAAFKTRLIGKIAAADPRLQKRRIALRGAGGEVTGADEDGITATLAGEQTEVHRWAEYGDKVAQKAAHKPVEELLRLVIDRDKADDWLAAGLLALVCHDVPFAERCFEKAGSLGAKIDAQLAPLADAAFRAASRLLDEKQPSEADAALARVEEKYSGIPWFASHKRAVDAGRALAKRLITEAEAEELYAQAVQYFNKKELHDVKALVEQLKRDYPGTKPVIDRDRTPSLSELEIAVAGLVRLVVRLDGKGDFKGIQEAIDAAKPGALIEIQDNGPYREMLTIPGEKKSLNIRGRKGCWPVVMSAGGSASIGTLVAIDAEETRLERLILLHNAPGGDNPCCVSIRPAPVSLRSTLVFMPTVRGNGLLIERERGNGGATFDGCLIIANAYGHGAPVVFNNCIVSGKTGFNFTTVARFQFCMVSTIEIGAGSVELLDSIAKDIVNPAKRIANCDFLADSMPGGGVNCFRMDPQFRDPKNLDFRLMPTSPCRHRASDGGDIGCRYTPEMLELCKLAVKLVQMHYIKL